MSRGPRFSESPGASAAYRLTAEKLAERLGVDPSRGLSGDEARRRRRRHGANRLEQRRRGGAWRILVAQFKSLVVLLLLAASVTAAAFGRHVEAVAVAAALALNAVIGFGTELQAVRSMDALRGLGQARARVWRDGEESDLPAAQLVPGDVVLLKEGNVVPADLRLLSVENLQCNESALTGESEPVTKSVHALEDGDVPLAERANMAFKGTAVTRGAATGLVTATGRDTEVGRISRMVEEAEEAATPLERRLDRLGRRLIFLVLGVGALVAVSGLAAGKPLFVMVETALALAIAAVPEGLPIVATVALGRGMWRMARRNALVKRLSAVETLGATTVILTDKTGTLTENRMSLRRLALARGDVEIDEESSRERDGEERTDLHDALRVGVLCSNAELDEGDESGRGEPMEQALLRAGRALGLERPELLESLPEEREESFDSDVQMMATFHRQDGAYLVAVKGAPEAVLQAASRERRDDEDVELDDERREAWRRRNEELGGQGLRVLALAQKRAADKGGEPYDDLTWLGLAGFRDPPRNSVKSAIASCRAAGVHVVMVTGDQPATAAQIAREVGLTDDEEPRVVRGSDATGEDFQKLGIAGAAPVFARVTPARKLDLVEGFQEAGAVVGMTGDGVNDAPALKKADIGIAMGRRGTEVARQTGDIVLKDDSFDTIVAAIGQGRTIFRNIRTFVVFLLSGNLGQILAVSAAAVAAAPLPLRPLQILFLNLLFDVFPALALGVGADDPRALKRPPRDPAEAILTRRHWSAISGFGVALGGSVLVVFVAALKVYGLEVEEAVTVAFLAYGLARLWHVFNMRSPDSGIFVNEVVRNPWVWAAAGVCTLLLGAAVVVPGLARLLDVEPLSAVGWALVAAGSLAPLLLGQMGLVVVGLWLRRRVRESAPAGG